MIRPQYHFRPSPNGFYAWDIVKLLRTHAHLVPMAVPLSAIAALAEDWWFGTGTVPTPRALAAHMAQVAAVDRSYPILLDADGRLMDGMHRVVQALMAGDDTILAMQLPQMPAPDYTDVMPSDLPYADIDPV